MAGFDRQPRFRPGHVPRSISQVRRAPRRLVVPGQSVFGSQNGAPAADPGLGFAFIIPLVLAAVSLGQKYYERKKAKKAKKKADALAAQEAVRLQNLTLEATKKLEETKAAVGVAGTGLSGRDLAIVGAGLGALYLVTRKRRGSR